jgi:hypothetical protein
LVGLRRSGLSAYLAAQLGGLRSLDAWQTNLIIAVATTFITEVRHSSNSTSPWYFLLVETIAVATTFITEVRLCFNST